MTNVYKVGDSVKTGYYFTSCAYYRLFEEDLATCFETCVVTSATVCVRNIRSNMTLLQLSVIRGELGRYRFKITRGLKRLLGVTKNAAFSDCDGLICSVSQNLNLVS